MSSTERQNSLLVNQDWTKIYQTFKKADFTSYDFDTIRRTMIAYLKENYPETFNDYIESSEYIALIDLIAYTAQAISFRVDLNARENFIDTASRRESILRLARLLSYAPKRNQNSTGFLKVNAIATTENVTDSGGIDLANTAIVWNDAANSNFLEQFTVIFNAALASGQKFGRPILSGTIGNIATEQYKLATTNNDIPLFTFTRSINGVTMPFEMVPATFLGEDFIYEESPIPSNNFSMIYRNDGAGFGSALTGFFLYFKQGSLGSVDFNIAESTSNQIVNLPYDNINDNDVWLYSLTDSGLLDTQWTKIPSIAGNNVIYNSVAVNNRNVYTAVTKANDQVDLTFADGTFGNIPSGNFRSYYRTSNGLQYQIVPGDMQDVTVDIPYVNADGQNHTLSLTASLQQTISNATTAETNASIKVLAPQSYYTSDRMITGEDYQVVPLTINQSIAKVRSVNRAISGTSRYYDLKDVTGAYSATSLVLDDGLIYNEKTNPTTTFTFNSSSEILTFLRNSLNPIMASKGLYNFYLSEYARKSGGTSRKWNLTTSATNSSTGYFYEEGPLSTGESSTTNLKYVIIGSLLKFIPPTGQYFKEDGTLTASSTNGKSILWTKVTKVVGDGSNQGIGNLLDGTGPITLADVVPDTAQLTEIIYPIQTALTTAQETEIIGYAEQHLNFGLRYDQDVVGGGTYQTITSVNLSASNIFATSYAGNTTSANLDASWFIKFSSDGETYTVTYRNLDYLFESKEKNRFYFDETTKIYDSQTGRTVKDLIKVLKSNAGPDSSTLTQDYNFEITGNAKDLDGYNDTRKMKVGFLDTDDDGALDDPDSFTSVVAPNANPTEKYIFFKKNEGNGFNQYDYTTDNFVVRERESEISSPSDYENGQLFYFYHEDENAVKQYDNTTGLLVATTDYIARQGRADLIYQYKHGAPKDRRIDPSVSNLQEIYTLTKAYDTEFRQWIDGGQEGTQPSSPTVETLTTAYLKELSTKRAISDDIIFVPIKYRILFGSKAEDDLQATFKVVKNPDLVITDNEIKSSVIAAINDYFILDNWNFGDTFYFTELATYIHGVLAPNIASVVIVPKSADNYFGSLFEIRANADEIFISGATVDNVEIIDKLTATNLQSTGSVVTSTTAAAGTEAVTSATGTSVSTTSTTTTTSSSSSSSSGGSGY